MRYQMSRWVVGLLCLIPTLTSAHATEYHAATDGTPRGNGSPEHPWDLPTALHATSVVMPGDTLWIHAGTYRGGFTSTLAGTPTNPVHVRGARDGRVAIDTRPRDDRDNGLFSLQGADAIYRDLEISCSDFVRATKFPGSWPEDVRGGNIDIRGDRITAANLIVHDCPTGFGFWGNGEGGEIYGCVIYNNGFRGPDRGHGHAIYAQNAKGTKRLVDNIVFHQFAYGIHVYGSEKASLRGFEIEGNIAFENGCLSRSQERQPGIFVGGGTPVSDTVVRDNVIFGGTLRLGYPWGPTNRDVICTGNYAEGFTLRDFERGTISKNVFVGESHPAIFESAQQKLVDGLQWNENEYYVTDGRWGDFALVEGAKSRGMTFDEWKLATKFDANSKFVKGKPTNLRTMVRPNRFEAGRAHVAIVNPEGRDEIAVDLSSVLAPSQRFRIVSAKDIFGEALHRGAYDGKPVTFPMRKVSPPTPVGLPDARTPTTEPYFAAFVVLPE